MKSRVNEYLATLYALLWFTPCLSVHRPYTKLSYLKFNVSKEKTRSNNLYRKNLQEEERAIRLYQSRGSCWTAVKMEKIEKESATRKELQNSDQLEISEYESDTDEGSVWSEDNSVMESDVDDDYDEDSNEESDESDEESDEEIIEMDNVPKNNEIPLIRNNSQIFSSHQLSSFSLLEKSQLGTSKIGNSTTAISITDNNDPSYTPSDESVINQSKSDKPNLSNNSSENSANKSQVTPKEKDKKKKLPNYANMKVPMAKKLEVGEMRIRKRHLCIYCKKDYVKLKQHLLSKHKDEPDVKTMRAESSQMKGSRNPMKLLYSEADLLYNTNRSINKGDLRVTRAPVSIARAPEDFTVCDLCKKTLLCIDFRKHYKKCSGKTNKDCRNLAMLGRRFIIFCSPRAKPALKEKVLAYMRNDQYTKALRYDELIIQYGNEISGHLRGQQHKGNIVTQLRRLARLKVTLKLKELSDMFLIDSVKTVEAIETLSNKDGEPNSEVITHPTVARNLNTLVKAVHNTYSVMLIKQKKDEKSKSNLREWLVCYEKDFKTGLSRVAAESRGVQIRRQTNELPLLEDIKLLHSYLSKECERNYELLSESFDEQIYTQLLKLCLTRLQVTNCRRPGDIERVFLSDYESIEKIGDTDNERYNKLSEEAKSQVSTYSVLRTRGKLGRNIKVLIPRQIKIYIDKLIELRSELDISVKNLYLFALPKTATSEIRYPSAYVLLSRFAEACGAAKPHLLRATKLRKYMATSCIGLELNDGELNDLAGFMGHHVDIHKKHYRQNIIDREIPMMLRFIKAAMGEPDDEETNHQEVDELEQEDQDFEGTFASADETIQPENKDQSKSERNKNAGAISKLRQTQKKGKAATANRSLTKSKKNRISYSDEEKNVLRTKYSNYINGKAVAPSLSNLRDLLDKYNYIFHKDRTDKALKTYLLYLKTQR